MAGRSSKAVALRRYREALDKVTAAEKRVTLAKAEADLEAQRFILHGGTEAELNETMNEAEDGE